METVGIEKAPWWLPHSVVIVKEDYTAADEAWVQARMVKIGMQGNGKNAMPDMQVGKERGILQIERMVQPGSVVAVQRSRGRVKTVNLPQEAEDLLYNDLAYILQQIDVLNEVMTPQEQTDFLPSVSEPVGETLSLVK